MPTIIVEPKDYGYAGYKNRTLPAGTTVDLTGSTFLTQQLPTLRNAYPVNVGGGPGCRVKGARVRGTTKPDNAGWGARYIKEPKGTGARNCCAVVATDSDDFTFENIRVHDAWDALRVEGVMPLKWRMEHCWVSNNHDDAIEADNSNKQNGTIYDTMIDGSYVLLSATNNKEPGRIRLEKTLMRLHPFPGAHNEGPRPLQPGHKLFFKVRNGHTLDFIDLILRCDQTSNAIDRECEIPSRRKDGGPQWTLGECRNTVVLWSGKGDFPYKVDRRIEIVRDPDHKIWNAAKADWIARHPDVPRFDDVDPPAVVAPSPPSPDGYRIVRAPGSVSIDADLADYAAAAPLRAATARASIDARVMWSDAGLHFGFKVVDPAVVADTLSEHPWRQASVEIMIDPTGDGGSAMSGADVQILITPQGRIWATGPVNADALNRAVSLTADGYTAELLVPFPAGFNRKRCRLNIALNDGAESVMLGGDQKQFLVPDKWMPAHAD